MPSLITRKTPTGLLRPTQLGGFCGLLLFAFGAEKANSEQATLVWTPNPEPDIAAYIVRYGTASGNHAWAFNVGNVTSMTFTNMVVGQPYYFVVSAVNYAGLESDLSVEVSYTPQEPDDPPPPPFPTPDPVVITNYTLSVLAGSGVEPIISLQPEDRDNVGGGVPPLTRVYAQGSVVAVSAPDLFAGNRFAYWTLDGTPVSTEPRILLAIESDLTLEANYIDDRLIAHWKLDEGAGLSAKDASINGHHARLVKGPGWVNGVYQGAALAFDGINDYVEVPDHDQLEFAGQDFTLSLWILATGSTPQAVVEKRHESNSGMFLLALNRHPAVPGAFSIYTGNTWVDSTFRGFTDGTWRHVTVTHDAEGFKLYHNGSLDSTYPIRGTYQPTDYPLMFGLSFALLGNWPFAGAMDDIRLYHRSLGQEEIVNLIAQQAASSLLLRVRIRPADGQVQLIVDSDDSDPIPTWLVERLEILASDDPAAPIDQWAVIPSPFLDGSLVVANDPSSLGRPQRFYLLRERQN